MNNLIGPKKPSTTVQNLSLLFAIYAVFFNLFWSCSALSVYSNLANYFLNNFDISSLNITGTGLSETAADGDAADSAAAMMVAHGRAAAAAR